MRFFLPTNRRLILELPTYHSFPFMSEQFYDLSDWGTRDGDSALQIPLATCGNHTPICLIYVLPLPFDTCARVFKHRRVLNQQNFVAATQIKRREKKNSLTVLKYCQFLCKINTATTGCLYHCENKLFFRIYCLFGLYSHVYRNSTEGPQKHILQRMVCTGEQIPHADKCSYL